MLETVRSSRPIAIAFTLLAILGCNTSDDPGSPMANATAGVFANRSAEDGLVLTADPVEVVIDTTDPATPTDPANDNKFYGETTLTATATDPETGDPQPNVELTFSSDGGMLASGGSPVMTDTNGLATDTLRLFEDDAEMIEVSVADGTRMDTITVTNTVILPNDPPVADAGGDVSTECQEDGGATVTLDGAGSSDPDSSAGTNDDIVLFEWFEDFGTATETALGEGVSIDVVFPVGSHSVTLRVTDAQGETDTDTIVVEVVDITAPTVDVSLSTSELWPPNHDMWPIEATVDAGDCNSPLTIVLVSVESNEPVNDRGDGNTEPDVVGAELGSEDYEFMVRAERSGTGSGRIYTVTYTVTDPSGNATTEQAFIVVPHDQGH